MNYLLKFIFKLSPPRLTHFPSKPGAPVSTTTSTTATGKRIVPARKGPTVNPRDELMAAIRGSGGIQSLRKVTESLNIQIHRLGD